MAHVYACLPAQRRGPIASLSGSKSLKVSIGSPGQTARIEQCGFQRRQNARFWKWTSVLAISAAEVPSASYEEDPAERLRCRSQTPEYRPWPTIPVLGP